jgi:thioredoxin-related protein
MNHFKYALLSLFLLSSLHADTMYTLAGIKKVYPVVELQSSKTPKSFKEMIKDAMIDMTTELGISTKGHDQRALAIIVNESFVKKSIVINIKLIIGEQVTRLDSDTQTFALTYQDVQKFIYEEGMELEEKYEDALDSLFSKFADQYREENKSFKKVVINEKYFAKELGYESNYAKAMERAKKEHKNVMLVLVSNFCPWCRKFEQRVLLKQQVHKLVSKSYIPVILNKEKEPFPKELNMSFTPIVHFISYKTSKKYQTVVGYNNKDEFLYLIKNDKNR